MEPTALLFLRRKACWEFFRPKNPTASAGCEPTKLGTKSQHGTSRPPKPLKFAGYNILCHLGVGWGLGDNFAISTCVLYRPHMHLAKTSHFLILPYFLFFLSGDGKERWKYPRLCRKVIIWDLRISLFPNLQYFSIDNAHLMYNAHPKLFQHSFWCIDNARDAN
jgi:hypothetical protein